MPKILLIGTSNYDYNRPVSGMDFENPKNRRMISEILPEVNFDNTDDFLVVSGYEELIHNEELENVRYDKNFVKFDLIWFVECRSVKKFFGDNQSHFNGNFHKIKDILNFRGKIIFTQKQKTMTINRYNLSSSKWHKKDLFLEMFDGLFYREKFIFGKDIHHVYFARY
jgi:hypothetical protein